MLAPEETPAAIPEDILMSRIETVTEILSRSDIAPYARIALERLLTALTVECEHRSRNCR